MQQIDYKKKYEEAIERLKQWDREHRSGYTIQERDEFIFPELRESEDEKNIDFLIHLIEHNIPNHSFAFGDRCAYGYKSKEEAINMLKSIRYRIISQPKQEWSEEDEQTFIKSVEALEDFWKFELADWLKEHKLKFLKPQSHWEPSDEQMVVLNDIITNGHLSNANERILKGLQEQLKKLREE